MNRQSVFLCIGILGLFLFASCASGPPPALIQTTVRYITDSSIEVPAYKTVYIYATKDGAMKQTDDPSTIPWGNLMPVDPGVQNPNKIRVQDGTETVYGFNCIFDNGQSLFLEKLYLNILGLQEGSLVEYRGGLKYSAIESVDGRIVASELEKYLAEYEEKSDDELREIRKKKRAYRQIAADRILSQRGFTD